jgi:hypothetical protein
MVMELFKENIRFMMGTFTSFGFEVYALRDTPYTWFQFPG